jgi:integrase/recombinase XerC
MQPKAPRPESWLDMMPAWTAHMRSARRSPRTIELRTYQVRRFFLATGLEVRDVKLDHLRNYMDNPKWKPNTCQVVRSSLAGFFSFANDEGYLKKNPSRRLASPKVPNGIPKPASDQAVADALEKAKPMVRLMVQLGMYVGLRAMEIAQVRTDDVTITSEGATLRIVGKGSKTRIVPISDETAELIIYNPEGYVFPGRIEGHIAPATVSRYVSLVLPPGVTCHKLRHRYATRAYRHSGHNLLALQRLMGHASPATTSGYADVDDDELWATSLSAA